MAHYFIEAYDKDGRQILGTGRGQASFEAKKYRGCGAYKALRDILSSDSDFYKRVDHFKVVVCTEQNIYGQTRCIETVGR